MKKRKTTQNRQKSNAKTINIPKFICVHVHLAADIEKESSGVEEEEDLEPGTFEIPIFTEEFLDHNKGL